MQAELGGINWTPLSGNNKLIVAQLLMFKNTFSTPTIVFLHIRDR